MRRSCVFSFFPSFSLSQRVCSSLITSRIPVRNRFCLVSSILAVHLFTASFPTVAAEWTIIDLGLLPGGSFSHALGVNDNGQVVGRADISGGFQRAFLWSRDSGMQDLGTLPGGGQSCATGINNSGQ